MMVLESIFLLLCLSFLKGTVMGMVALNKPGFTSAANVGTIYPGTNNIEREVESDEYWKPCTLRVMKSCEEDLDTVSTLLSQAISIESENASLLSAWKVNMERLRAKSDLQKQLQFRLNALSIGEYIFASQTKCLENNEDFLPELPASNDFSRILWSHDNFRSKVEKAANLSLEKSVWKNHNFALPPEDPYMLQHIMLSVKDKKNLEIVGFCEVAMLAAPSCSLSFSDDKIEQSACVTKYVPTLVNVITSPSHRRQGIASRLVEAAIRYVRAQWRLPSSTGVTSMGLYVDENNNAAISLYQKEGFVTVGRSDDSTNLLFMELSLLRSPFE